MSASLERSSPLASRRSTLPRPIRGVGLSIESWAQSCASDEPVAVTASGPMWALQCEFPAVTWALMGLPPGDALIIPERGWRASSANLYHWDRAMLEPGEQPRWLVVHAEDDGDTLSQTAREILTRYQRLLPRSNGASSGATFQRVLSGHRALHDLSLPLVRADYDHALDVWQWILRLCPGAGLALQLAGLFHDVERLMSEAERRVEHLAPDYQAFKNAHAEAGAELARRVLEACGIDAETSGEVARLIREHELPHGSARSADGVLLADADALSFFSLNSPGFADYYGPEHTRKKVRYTLGRMSSAAVRRLADVRLREDVRRHLAQAARTEADAALRQVSV
jgi:hypothetical protein